MTENRVSFEEYSKAIAENNQPVANAEWHGVPIKIKKSLSFEETLKFINSVVETCFADNNGANLLEAKDFVERCFILVMYSNFELPEDLESKYSLLYASDIISFILEHINTDQLNQMTTAIDNKIDYRLKSNVDAINKQMNELIKCFAELEDKMSSAFEGVDSDTVSKITSAITNGAFDENKLVQAFVNTLHNKNNASKGNGGGKGRGRTKKSNS